MAEPVRVALLGYGAWGRKLLETLRQGGLYDTVYVHFPSLKRLSETAVRRRYGSRFMRDSRVILADESISAVFIAAPADAHYRLARECLTAGKHVFVEKPLTLRLKEARELARIARLKGLRIQTDFTWTFAPALRKAADLLAQGAIGRLRHVRLTWRQLGRLERPGIHAALTCHALSILGLFMPLRQLRFQGAGLAKSSGAWSAALVHFSGPRGLTGFIDVSVDDPARERKVVLSGERGAIVYQPMAKPSLLLARFARSPEGLLQARRRAFRYSEGRHLQSALKTFHKVLRGGQADNLPLSFDVTRVIERLSRLRR